MSSPESTPSQGSRFAPKQHLTPIQLSLGAHCDMVYPHSILRIYFFSRISFVNPFRLRWTTTTPAP